MAKIPAEHSHAFWAWAKCVGELIFWATNPDAETTSGDGWREHFRNDIRDKGDRARDASPDDVTRNQVTRSRSLASQLVRMLNETPELNASPCRNWSQVARFVVEQLAELQAVFAKLGDGELPNATSGGTKPQVENSSGEPKDDWWATTPPPAGEEWYSKPLIGTLKKLARCIGKALRGDRVNVDTLANMHRKSVWIFRVNYFAWQAYFHNDKIFSEANAELAKILDEEAKAKVELAKAEQIKTQTGTQTGAKRSKR